MTYKTQGLLLFGAAAIVFASIYIVPAADPADSPKAWAHGVGYVLPRLLVADFLAFCSAVVFAHALYRGAHRGASFFVWFLAVVLFVPWVLMLAFLIRVVFLV